MKNRLVVLTVLFAVLCTPSSPTTADSRPAFSGVYHEASCPAVDRSRMQRMKRHAAEAVGLLPAPDCHPNVSVRYLGTCCPASTVPSGDTAEMIPVGEYTRKDGTVVGAHLRRKPNTTD
jgi:hypothetical protein